MQIVFTSLASTGLQQLENNNHQNN